MAGSSAQSWFVISKHVVTALTVGLGSVERPQLQMVERRQVMVKRFAQAVLFTREPNDIRVRPSLLGALVATVVGVIGFSKCTRLLALATWCQSCGARS